MRTCRFCQKVRSLILIVLITILLFSLLYYLPKWFGFDQTNVSNNSFAIKQADSVLKDGNYLVNAKLSMDFPDAVKEALENGVPLLLIIELNLIQKNEWWDDVIKTSNQRFEIRYHALMNLYQIKNLSNQQKFTFDTQAEALALLGNIHQAHLMERDKLEPGKHHEVKLRVYMDIWSLPEVLRPVASLSPDWHLDSQWYSWYLN